MYKILCFFICILLFASCRKEVKADFEITGITNVGEKLNFTNHSTNSDVYEWDFGDGNSSEFETPSHIYLKPGTYTISLKAIGISGSSTLSKTITITGTTFSFKNLSSFDIPSFVTFALNGTEVIDYLSNGSLSIGHETTPIITTRSEVMFAISVSDVWYFGGPYPIIKENHNPFFIYDTTRVFMSGKGTGYIFNKTPAKTETRKLSDYLNL